MTDLGRSVAFYRALFGMEPAKLRPDYAKFEPDSPPLVLSLEPTPRADGGPLNHVGIRLPDSKALVALQTRMEAAGLRSQREEGVECCYAKQTKFWLHDPDGTLWEVYTLDGDLEHRGAGQREETVMLNAPAVTRTVEWEHRMNEPMPERIPLNDSSADEVRLRGTFNLTLAPEQRTAVVAEALRVLKPSGRLFVHVLTGGEQAVDGPELPGPASVVRHVPRESEPVRLLEEAGLTGVRLLKFDANPCFVRNGIAMRETQIAGWKPAVEVTDKAFDVVYRGPFERIDAGGRVYPRGVRVAVSSGEAERFRAQDLSAQFTVIERASALSLTADACSITRSTVTAGQ